MARRRLPRLVLGERCVGDGALIVDLNRLGPGQRALLEGVQCCSLVHLVLQGDQPCDQSSTNLVATVGEDLGAFFGIECHAAFGCDFGDDLLFHEADRQPTDWSRHVRVGVGNVEVLNDHIRRVATLPRNDQPIARVVGVVDVRVGAQRIARVEGQAGEVGWVASGCHGIDGDGVGADRGGGECHGSQRAQRCHGDAAHQSPCAERACGAAPCRPRFLAAHRDVVLSVRAR